MSTPNTTVETVSTGADKAKVAVAALLVLAGVVAFYMLGQQDLWKRVGALLGLIAVGVVIFFLSEPGKQLIAFGRDSYREVLKVVWPTRNEALQMTMYVFAFVVVMAFILGIVDWLLKLVLFDLILGWRR